MRSEEPGRREGGGSSDLDLWRRRRSRALIARTLRRGALLAVVAAAGLSCSPSEGSLLGRGEALAGSTAAEVRQRLGDPDRRAERTWEPMMGPGEGLTLAPGDRYDEWVYVYGDKELYLFLRDSGADAAGGSGDGGSRGMKVIDHAVHVEGRIY